MSRLDHFSQQRVLVVGDAMVDRYLCGKARRLCPEGPVPVVAVDQVNEAAGGAANTAVNVAQLGATAALLSVMGKDADGAALQQRLGCCGVKLLAIAAPERTTLTKQRVVANGQIVVRFDQGSTTPITAARQEQLMAQLDRDSAPFDAVIVSDYGYGVCTPQVVQALIKQTPIAIVDSKRLPAYRHLSPTAVKPNYAETIALLDLPPAADRLAQMRSQGDALLAATGAKIVVVTLDIDGALTFEAGQPPHHQPAHPAPDGHAVGAGDTFVSALTLALAAGATGIEATAIASAATAVVVQSPGTTTCSLNALKSRMESSL